MRQGTIARVGILSGYYVWPVADTRRKPNRASAFEGRDSVEMPAAKDESRNGMALPGKGEFPQRRQHEPLGDILDSLRAIGAKVVPVDDAGVGHAAGTDRPAVSNRGVNN